MHKGRLEAFSDGVIAIIITIMVLELKAPHGTDYATLAPLVPVFLSYVLSFIFVGIYWNNHHHMMQAVRAVTGPILWANMHLLFWLSLVPFATAWMGENHFAARPVAFYGAVLFLCAVAFVLLSTLLARHEGADSKLARAMGSDVKGKISLAIYAAAVVVAFLSPPAAMGLYVLVAVIWFVPDRRIERVLEAG
ncbi:TMEM175 family protein [Caulobacter sp. LARHSG274]